MKPTDQELQKIAEDLEIKLRGLETPNAVDDEDHETIHDFTLMRLEAITQSLTKVRDAQEVDLKIAREALNKLKKQGHVHGEDCGVWLSDCNDDEHESPIHNSCTCGLKELHETINEALLKMGVK